MSKREGFFTRAEARGKIKRKAAKPQDRTLDTLRRLGLRGVRNMNPGADSPNMDPLDNASSGMLILGLCPSEVSDRSGKHLSSRPERRLAKKLRTRASVDNICRTLPPDGRKPSWEEVECFRETVEESIQELKPRVILGLGNEVFKWMLPGISGSVRVARGRKFPVWVGDHACWFMPILSPDVIEEASTNKKFKLERIPGDEWVSFWERDIKAADDLLRSREQADPVHPDEAFNNIHILTDYKDIVQELEYWQGRKSFALDLETSHLRPYSEGATVLTCALGTSKRTAAFPLGHASSKLRGKQLARLLDMLRKLLTSGKRVTIQNLSFDLEWLVWLLGPEVARGSVWHDTMMQAFVRDQRRDSQNLDFLSRQHLGLPLKSMVQVNHKDLASEPLEKLLRYNGVDTKYTYSLGAAQHRLVKEEGLSSIYREQVRRVPTLVLAQREGLLVDQNAVREMHEEFEAELTQIDEDIQSQPVVKKFRKKYGEFNPASNPALIKVFRDMLEHEGGRKPSGKYGTDAAALEAMSDVPLAKLISRRRTAAKLKGTYVDRYLPDHPKTYVYPDGRVHTNFNTTFAATGRLSSDKPNMQNDPKRKSKGVRRRFVAPPRHTWIAADYGQIEARVIAMLSKDKAFCRALWERYDIHLHWAEELADRWPKVLRSRKGEIKTLRGDIKNGWVFPQFFGASWRSCAKNLDLPEEVAEEAAEDFWKEFRDVRTWQRQLLRQYARRGYVESLTGRRRHGPLSYNMVINTPVQATASDIVQNAMDRCSEHAYETDQLWLQPVLTIHDELSFMVPDSEVDSAIEQIVDLMLDVPWDWVNVPTTIEVESGKVWSEMSHVGDFSSDD